MSESVTSRQLYQRLLRYSLQHWRAFGLAIAGMAGFAATDTTLIWLMKPLLDGSFTERDPTLIHWLPVAILLLFLVRGAASWASAWGMAWVSRQVIKQLRVELFEKFLSMTPGAFAERTPGKLLARLTYDVERIAASASSVLTTVVRDGLTVIGLTGLMIWLSPELTVFVLLVGPLVALLVSRVSKRFRSLSRDIQNSMSDVTDMGSEAIRGHRVIRIFGAQQVEAARFEAINERNRQLNMTMTGTSAMSAALIQFIAALAIAGIIWAATAGPANDMSAGTFVAFMGAMMGMLTPIRHLNGINAKIQRGLAAAESIFAVIDLPDEPAGGKHAPATVQGAIRFDNVVFRYPGAERPALNGFSLDIAAGETVALVGQSGAGKSTVLGLLPRFQDIESGSISVDGVPITDWQLAALRSAMALVDQEVILFAGTVAENIAYGELEGADRVAVEAAADQANAQDFVGGLPAGFDSEVGHSGQRLSGGQRQRLAIARALLKQAPILLLDEATSALDSATEQRIQAALETLLEGRTALIVAHRLSTIRFADRIAVVEAGRIVELGSHAELLAAGGHYARLHQMQAGTENSAA